MVQLLSDNFLISCTNIASQKQKYIGHLWNSLIYLKCKLGEKTIPAYLLAEDSFCH